MNRKDRLRIKLVMYTLLESRTFILNYYDADLAKKIVLQKGDKDRHGMLLFTLESVIPFEKTKTSVDNILEELLREVRLVNNTVELLYFAENSIPDYVNRLRNNIILVE